jgi:hypothetical protein
MPFFQNIDASQRRRFNRPSVRKVLPERIDDSASRGSSRDNWQYAAAAISRSLQSLSTKNRFEQLFDPISHIITIAAVTWG